MTARKRQRKGERREEMTQPGCDYPVTSRRVFLSRGWDSPWWRPLILVGVRGGDENCNRTVGLRLPGERALFLCLNVPLRQRPCDECQALTGQGAEGSLSWRWADDGA